MREGRKKEVPRDFIGAEGVGGKSGGVDSGLSSGFFHGI